MISGTIGDNLIWELDDNGVLVIDGSGDMINFSMSYSPWKDLRISIKQIVINNGVTSIGNYAFFNCKDIVNIIIPNSIISIGNYAFTNCQSLTSVTIPDSVTSIGQNAFFRCIRLTSVILSSSLTSININTFNYCSSLTTIIIPDSVTSISSSAFENCSSMTNAYYKGNELQWNQITIESDNEYLINAAIFFPTFNITFNNKQPLQIKEGAFSNNLNLTNFSHKKENPIYSLGDKVFEDCEKLVSLQLQEGMNSVGSSCFNNCNQLQYITIPTSVETIGENCIQNCNSLEVLEIPFISTKSKYERGNFTDVVDLTNTINNIIVNITKGNLVINSNNEKQYIIPANSFGENFSASSAISWGVEKISRIVLNKNIRHIGTQAFANCSNLTQCILPTNNQLTFGKEIFINCDSLSTIEYFAIGNVENKKIEAIEDNYVTGLNIDKQINWNIIKCVDVTNNNQKIFLTTNDEFYGEPSDTYAELTVNISNKTQYVNICYIRTGEVGNYTYTLITSTSDITTDVTKVYKPNFYVSGEWRNKNNDTITGQATLSCLNWKKSELLDQFEEDNKDSAIENVGACGNNLTYSIMEIDIGSEGVPNNKQCLKIKGNGTMFNYISADNTPWNNEELYAVFLPQNISSIGNYAFAECSQLNFVYRLDDDIIKDDDIKTVLINRISDADDSNSINLDDTLYTLNGRTSSPSLITTIGDYAFSDCSNIQTINIRDDIDDNNTTIGHYAFSNCSNVTILNMGIGTKYIGDYAFQNLKIAAVTIEAGTIGNLAFDGCNQLREVTTIVGNNQKFETVFGQNTIIQNLTLISGMLCSYYITSTTLKTLTIEKNMQSNHNTRAFVQSKCPSLSNVYVNSSQLAAETFFDFDLAFLNIYIGDDVTTMSANVFVRCTCKSLTLGRNLQSIYYNIVELGPYQSDKRIIYWNAVNLTVKYSGLDDGLYGSTIIFGKETKEIPSYAFNKGSVDIIYIPKNIVSISSYALGGNNNVKIFYEGSQTDWNNINIASDAFNNTTYYLYYNQSMPSDTSTISMDTVSSNYLYDDKEMAIASGSNDVLLSANIQNESDNYINNYEVLYLLNGKEYAWKLFLYDDKYDVYITDNNTYADGNSYLPLIYAPINTRTEVGQRITLQGEESYTISNIQSFNQKNKIFYRQSKGVIEGQINYYGVLNGKLKYDMTTKQYSINSEIIPFLPTSPVNFSTGTQYNESLRKGTICYVNKQLQVTLDEGSVNEYEFDAPIVIEKAVITEASISSDLLAVVKPNASFTTINNSGVQTIEEIVDYYNIKFTPGIEITSSGYSSLGITMFDTDLILPNDLLSTQVLIVTSLKDKITIVGSLNEEIKQGQVNENFIQLMQTNDENATSFNLEGTNYIIYDIDRSTNTIYFSDRNKQGYIIKRTDTFEHEIVLQNYMDISGSDFDLTDLHLTLNYINVFDIDNITKYEETIGLSDTEVAYLVTCSAVVQPTDYEVMERSLEKEALIERYSSILTVSTFTGLEPNHTLVDKNTVYYIYSNNIETPAYYFSSVDKGNISLLIETNDMSNSIHWEEINNDINTPYTINCSNITVKGTYTGSISYYIWDLQEWDIEDQQYYSIYTEENKYTSKIQFNYNNLQHNSIYRLILSIVTNESLVVSKDIYLNVNYMFNQVVVDGISVFKDCEEKAIAIDFTNLVVHVYNGMMENNTSIETTYTPFTVENYNNLHNDFCEDFEFYVVRQILNHPETACIIGAFSEQEFKKNNKVLTTTMKHQCCFYDYSFTREEQYVYSIIPKLINIQVTNGLNYYGVPYIINSDSIQYNLKVIQLIDTDSCIDNILLNTNINIYKVADKPFTHWTFKYNTDAKNITINTDKTLFESSAQYATVGQTNRNYKSGSITALLGAFFDNSGIGDMSSLTYRDSIRLQNKFQDFANNGKIKLLRDEIGNVLPVDITFKSCMYNPHAIPTNITISFEWTQVGPEINFGVYDVVQHKNKIPVVYYKTGQPFVIFETINENTQLELQVLNSDLLELQVETSNDVGDSNLTGYEITILGKISGSRYHEISLISDNQYETINTIKEDGLYKIAITGYSQIMVKLSTVDNIMVSCYGKEIKYNK